MENYLDKSDGMKVEIEALELLMNPNGQEEAEVCLRYILAHARRRATLSLAGAPRKDGRAAREAAKRLAGHNIRWNSGKGPFVSQKDEDAVAAAGLHESSVIAHCAAGEKWDKQKVVSDLQTRNKRGPHRQYGEMGGAPERVGGAGEALPGAQRGRGAFKRKTRSYGYSDGGPEGGT